MRGPNQPKPLTPADVRALVEIDRFGVLTQDQALRIGLAASRSQISRLLGRLENMKLIGRSKQRDPDYLALLPQLHFLKPGASVELERHTGMPATTSKRRANSEREIEHRRGIVDMHIALRAWADAKGWEVETFTTDFDPMPGAPGQPKRGRFKATMIPAMREKGKPFPPDATAHVIGPSSPSDPTRKRRGLLFEYERGGKSADLSKFWRVKLPLLRELAGGAPRNPAHEPLPLFVHEFMSDGGQLPIAGAVRFLIVFEDAARRDKALAKWPDRASDDWRTFFVKALPDLTPDFNGGWWQPDGTQTALFPGL